MDTRPPWKRSYRQNIWFGLFVVACGVYIAKEARDSFLTGKPVSMGHMSSMSGWEAAGFSLLVILLGFFFMAIGFGWNKSKDQQ